MTRINERSNNLSDYVEFIFSKATIINIFHQNGITRRKYIYIYRSLEIFFPMIHIFSFAFFLVRVHLSLYATVFFFFFFSPRLSCRHLHLYRDCYPSSFFFFFRRNLENCIYIISRNMESFDDSRMEYQRSERRRRLNEIFFFYPWFLPRELAKMAVICLNFYPRILNYSRESITTRWSSFNNNNACILFSKTILETNLQSLFSKPPPFENKY